MPCNRTFCLFSSSSSSGFRLINKSFVFHFLWFRSQLRQHAAWIGEQISFSIRTETVKSRKLLYQRPNGRFCQLENYFDFIYIENEISTIELHSSPMESTHGQGILPMQSIVHRNEIENKKKYQNQIYFHFVFVCECKYGWCFCFLLTPYNFH